MKYWDCPESKVSLNKVSEGLGNKYGLPKNFLTALKALFDILDENKSGFIKLSDIECRWKEEEFNPDVPHGLIDCLSKVQSANGLIDFERFCAGIKVCLLRTKLSTDDQVEIKNSLNELKTPNIDLVNPSNISSNRLPNQSLEERQSYQKVVNWNDSMSVQNRLDFRTKSMPQLRESNNLNGNLMKHYGSDPKILDGPKNKSVKNKIMNILKEWRNNVIQRSHLGALPSSKGPQTNSFGNDPDPKFEDSWPVRGPWRRETRRHTVSHGIDINTVKRLRQYEQEKELLLKGLEMVERAKDWYVRQINVVQGKIRFIGQAECSQSDCSIDAYQERINFQATRILTVNQHLSALMDRERGFPVHMNLALRPLVHHTRTIYDKSRQETINNVTIQRLKEQNRLLTEEVCQKNEKITKLEREKSALLRELFQSRSNPNLTSDDNGFM